MRVQFIFAWYDLWIGAYYDRAKCALYVLPLPCLGVVISRTSPAPEPTP
jgi:hypothetical protein